MSPHAALRLAARQIRGAGTLSIDQFVVSSTLANFSTTSGRRTTLSPAASIRLQCTLQTRSRPFSTLPPSKPSNDQIPSHDDASSSPAKSEPPQGEKAAETEPLSSDATPKEGENVKEPEDPQPLNSGMGNSKDTATTTEPELPSTSEDRRSQLSARFSAWMDDLQSRAIHATQTINDLTGYSAIEAIKAKNSRLEADLATAQERLRDARQNYKALTSHRAATQREVTTLLARKDTWNPTDLERFTTLYRLDHELETQVANASTELTEAEADESKLSADLNAGILKRYHEEQIWSDRIRRQSTWGTWGLMGVNILLFLGLQFVAEPWRRRRLIKGIAENEKGVMEDVKNELAEVKAALAASGLREQQRREAEEAEAAAAASAAAALAASGVEGGEAAPVTAVDGAAGAVSESETVQEPPAERQTWRELFSDPALLKAAILDLYSERRIDLRMRDASLLALEGAAAGATVVASVAFFVLRNSSGKA